MFSKPVEIKSKSQGSKFQGKGKENPRIFLPRIEAFQGLKSGIGERDPFDPEPAIKQGLQVKQRRRLRVSSAPKFQLWRQRRIAKSSDYRKQLSFFRPSARFAALGRVRSAPWFRPVADGVGGGWPRRPDRDRQSQTRIPAR
jgi:hypothetical protein